MKIHARWKGNSDAETYSTRCMNEYGITLYGAKEMIPMTGNIDKVTCKICLAMTTKSPEVK